MKKIAFVDLEGTLVKSSTWAEINKKVLGHEGTNLYRKFLKKEITYTEWIQILNNNYKNSGKKLNRKFFENEFKKLEIVEGADKFIENLKICGYYTVIISSSMNEFIESIKNVLSEFGYKNLCDMQIWFSADYTKPPQEHRLVLKLWF